MDFCCLPAHLVHLARICRDIAERCEGYIQYVLTSVPGCLPSEACYAIRRGTDFETLGWLTIFPLVCHQFDLLL